MSKFTEDPTTLVPGRLATFANWPYTRETDVCVPKSLAEAGFIYRPDLSNDSTQCFSCQKVFSDWDPKDNPLEQHQVLSPDCAYVKLAKEYDSYETAPRCAVIEAEYARFRAKFMHRFEMELEAPKRALYTSHLKRIEDALTTFVNENGIRLPETKVPRTRAAAARKRALR